MAFKALFTKKNTDHPVNSCCNIDIVPDDQPEQPDPQPKEEDEHNTSQEP